MGPVLALKTPKREPSERIEDAMPRDNFERPKNKLLLFWGCGETARPGQPITIDFALLAAGQLPPGLFGGERIGIAYPPSTSSWPTWGGWLNDDKPSQDGVPGNVSLIGAHKISGSYTPDIDFTLAQGWMVGLIMTQTSALSGALHLAWIAVPGATAHFAQLMGAAKGNEADGATIVFWSSSEVQTFISGLSDYVAPSKQRGWLARNSCCRRRRPAAPSLQRPLPQRQAG